MDTHACIETNCQDPLSKCVPSIFWLGITISQTKDSLWQTTKFIQKERNNLGALFHLAGSTSLK